MRKYMPMTKKNKKNKKVHNPITYNFTKKYIYFYYAFFWNKKFVLKIIIIIAIELSGHGIFASLFRLLNSMN